jgi:hypothetical protein
MGDQSLETMAIAVNRRYLQRRRRYRFLFAIGRCALDVCLDRSYDAQKAS